MKKVLVIFAVLCLGALPAKADINVAFTGPLTGPVAVYGEAALLGIQQAIDDVNKAGGINGQKILLKTYDDQCDPKQAVAVANRVVADAIPFVIQGDCSGSSIAAAKVFMDENILVINSVASNPQFTDEGGPAIFRASFRDDHVAPVLAEAIVKRFPHEKLAILNDQSTYGYGIAEGVRELVNKGGLKEVFFDSYDPASRDFSALITRLKEKDIQVLFVGGYPVEIATLARELGEAGLNIQIVAGDLSDQDFWKIAGKAGEGALFALPADPGKNKSAAFLKAKLDEAKETYNAYTFYGYAAAQVLAQGLEAMPEAGPSALAALLHQKTFDTVLGPWRFDKKGDIDNVPIALYRWHDGAFTEVEK